MKHPCPGAACLESQCLVSLRHGRSAVVLRWSCRPPGSRDRASEELVIGCVVPLLESLKNVLNVCKDGSPFGFPIRKESLDTAGVLLILLSSKVGHYGVLSWIFVPCRHLLSCMCDRLTGMYCSPLPAEALPMLHMRHQSVLL